MTKSEIKAATGVCTLILAKRFYSNSLIDYVVKLNVSKLRTVIRDLANSKPMRIKRFA